MIAESKAQASIISMGVPPHCLGRNRGAVAGEQVDQLEGVVMG